MKNRLDDKELFLSKHKYFSTIFLSLVTKFLLDFSSNIKVILKEDFQKTLFLFWFKLKLKYFNFYNVKIKNKIALMWINKLNFT